MDGLQNACWRSNKQLQKEVYTVRHFDHAMRHGEWEVLNRPKALINSCFQILHVHMYVTERGAHNRHRSVGAHRKLLLPAINLSVQPASTKQVHDLSFLVRLHA